MDEAGARLLLERIADTPAPAPRVDVALALRRGRRRLARRRAGAVAVSAVALAGVAAGVLVPLRGRAPAASYGHGVPAAAPRRFDPLVPYASFGWLPPQFGAAVSGMSWGRSALELSAAPPGYSDGPGEVDLVVYARGACRTGRGPGGYAQALSCPAEVSDAPLLRRAPAIRPGLPAYWVPNGLAWQYAPQAWAVVSNGPATSTGPAQHPVNRPLPAPSRSNGSATQSVGGRRPVPLASPPAAGIRAELLGVASHVRYSGKAAIRFPFRLGPLPAGWQLAQAAYTESGGRLLGTLLSAGTSPARRLTVTSGPGKPGACSVFDAGKGRRVTVDGAAGTRGVAGASRLQYVCLPDARGLMVSVTDQSPKTLTRALSHLRVLGSDPAGWTTSPLG